MKHFNYSLIILFFLAITSCNPLNKSIAEDLSIKDIAKITEKDTLFNSTYKIVDEFKKLNKDKLTLVKYSKLTWQKFHDYHSTQYDTTLWNPVRKQLSIDYNEKYHETLKKGIKHIDSWKEKEEKWKKDNSPQSFVNIKLTNLKTEYYEHDGSVQGVYFTFRLTSLKGTIDQVVWRIDPIAKINQNKDKPKNSINSQIYIYSSPFSKSTIGRFEASYKHKKLAGGKSSKQFLRDYNLNLEIYKVRENGINYELNGFNLPFDIKMYLEYEKEGSVYGENMKELYLSDIIKDNIDKQFKSKLSFTNEEIGKILKVKFPLAHNFLMNYEKLYINSNVEK